jgi:hypothetical protein
LFRKTKKNKLRKSLWHVLLLYERNINNQLFFDFDVFKKNCLPIAKIKSYENIMRIFQIIENNKFSINQKNIVPYQEPLIKCTVEELLETLRHKYYYEFSSRFPSSVPMSPANMKQFMEIVSLIYDKSIKSYKNSSPDYSIGDLFDLLFNSFYFEEHFADSPGKPKLFMEIVSKIYDKWQEEYKKRTLI